MDAVPCSPSQEFYVLLCFFQTNCNIKVKLVKFHNIIKAGMFRK